MSRSPEDVLMSLTSRVLHVQPSLPRTAPKMCRILLEATTAAELLHKIWECILQLRCSHPENSEKNKVHAPRIKLFPTGLLHMSEHLSAHFAESEDNKGGTDGPWLKLSVVV